MINEYITSIRAYLEMLAVSEEISHTQLNKLSSKIEELFEELEGLNMDNSGNYGKVDNSQPVSSSVDLNKDFDDIDEDLPF